MIPRPFSPLPTRRVTAAIAVAALVLAACGSDDAGSSADSPTADDLDGRTFTSTEVTGHELVAGSSIGLAFEGTSLSANTGCNTMNGAYAITDGVLEVDALAMTMMACPDELMDQDTWLSELLTDRPEITLDDTTLTITGDDATITFAEVEDAPLVGTTWVVTGTVANEAVASVPADAVASITIDDAGAVAVETGCNMGSGTVEVGDDTLTFGAIAVTERACADQAVNELEAAVLQTLQGEVRYEIDGTSLSLRTDGADGEIGLELTAES